VWLITAQGFYSVVADRDDPNRVLIRARAERDLQALGRQIPDLVVLETPGGDYAWRAYVSREDWERAAAELASEVDYPNFKQAVAARQGAERAHVYLEIWSILRLLQDQRARPAL